MALTWDQALSKDQNFEENQTVTMDNQNGDISASQRREATLFDKIFRDEDGKIVIAQKPNLPIIVGVVATLVTVFLPDSGNLWVGLDAVAFGAFFTWAWLELFRGVNYFRRTLGLLVMLGIIASRLSW